jgi:hypothetical protein
MADGQERFEVWLGKTLDDSGVTREYPHLVQLFSGALSEGAYLSRSIAKEIRAADTPAGTLVELIGQLVEGRRGHWFYAGWIDQAVLHVGAIRSGDASLVGPMLSEIDRDQVDQGGDMLIGFVPDGRSSFVTVEASPEVSRFCVRLRTECKILADRARLIAG